MAAPPSESPVFSSSQDEATPSAPAGSPQPRLSVSVRQLMAKLAGSGAIPASSVALALQDMHPEYGGGDWPNLYEKGTPLRYSIESWVERVLATLQAPVDSESTLHGRLLLVGLAATDTQFAPFLAEGGFLRRIEQEIREPLESLLTPDGRSIWQSVADPQPTGGSGTSPEPEQVAGIPDNVPTHSDHPADVDELGRSAFARALAARIERVRRDERWPGLEAAPSRPVWLWFLRERGRRAWRRWSGRDGEMDVPHGPGGFMLHLNGPWGAGKTSLLSFIKDELTDTKRAEPWLAIYFNAWRSERLGPPWWALSREVHRQSRAQLQAMAVAHPAAKRRASALSYNEIWWRALTGVGAPVLVVGLGVLVLALFALLAGKLSMASEQQAGIAFLEQWATTIGGWVAIAGAALSGLRYMVTGSARGASALLEVSGDPMRPMVCKFEDLVRLAGHPVVILIDDLDRCQFEYVARLLQGIQTLFWQTPVAYVVAADRQWLRAAYETQFGQYRGYVGESGRPLGYLFLEKLFQLSANVPHMGSTSARQYWMKLLGVAPVDPGELDEARGRAQQRLQQARTEADVLAATNEAAAAGDVVYAQAMREEAVVRLAAQEIEAHTAHVLAPFLDFLEPNPRAMKRMVNAYGVRRAIDVLRQGQTDRGVLALWTILEMRWPILSEHLAEHPDEVERIRAAGEPTVAADDDLIALYQSAQIRRLINGDAPDVVARLDAAAIRQCTGTVGGIAPEVMA